MENGRTLTFVDENNVSKAFQGELLFAFEMNGNKYVVYSKNEKNFDNNGIIYIGKIIIKNNKQYIEKIIDNEEYQSVKDIMKKMINYGVGENYA